MSKNFDNLSKEDQEKVKLYLALKQDMENRQPLVKVQKFLANVLVFGIYGVGIVGAFFGIAFFLKKLLSLLGVIG